MERFYDAQDHVKHEETLTKVIINKQTVRNETGEKKLLKTIV